MTDKPNYRVNRRDVKISERVAMAAVGQSVLRSQKVHGTDTSIMFAERAAGYHTSPHQHDCEQMNYIVSGEIFFFVDGRGYRCKAGDIMRIPRNKVHWAWNRGTETAVVFESHSPPLRDRGGDAVALLGPDDDAAKIQHMPNILVKMDQAEIDRIEARAIAEEGRLQLLSRSAAWCNTGMTILCTALTGLPVSWPMPRTCGSGSRHWRRKASGHHRERGSLTCSYCREGGI